MDIWGIISLVGLVLAVVALPPVWKRLEKFATRTAPSQRAGLAAGIWELTNQGGTMYGVRLRNTSSERMRNIEIRINRTGGDPNNSFRFIEPGAERFFSTPKHGSLDVGVTWESGPNKATPVLERFPPRRFKRTQWFRQDANGNFAQGMSDTQDITGQG